MKKAFRGQDEIKVQASPNRIWSILEDSSQLTQWADMVKHTSGKMEQLGSTRACQVEWNGRKDHIVERCIEAEPLKHIAWQMEEGQMTKLFSKIQFGFHLIPNGAHSTNLQLWFSYEPRGFFGTLMWHLMMKGQMEKLRVKLLGNIKSLAERAIESVPRHTTGA